MENKIELIAPIITDELKFKEIANVLSIPDQNKRQTDLQYFTAIFVSSGGNLNFAYFLPSELFKAKDTIDKKAVDLEHMERDVVGHIYDKAFVTTDDKMEVIDPIKSLKDENVDLINCHALIAGVVYGQRFPEVAQEIKMGKWKVSMECYYDSFDLKIGDVILPRKEAESLGYAEYIGKPVVLKLNGEEIGTEMVYRVLKGILFTGCGFVRNPANLPSVILEYASMKKRAEEENLIIQLENVESYMRNKQEKESLSIESKDEKEGAEVVNDKNEKAMPHWICNVCGGILEKDITPSVCPMCGAEDVEWTVTPEEQDNPGSKSEDKEEKSEKIEENKEEEKVKGDELSEEKSAEKEKSDVSKNLTKDYESVEGSGICVNYKMKMYDIEGEGGIPIAESKIIHEEWCNRYDQGCTTDPKGEATDFNCLRFKKGEIEVIPYLRSSIKEILLGGVKEMYSKEKSEKLGDIIKEIDGLIDDYKDNDGIEKAAKWTRQFINDLPDSAFAAIEPAYPKQTQNKNARHLPHHGGSGDLGKSKSNTNIDLPHLRNALARSSQVKPVTDSISQSSLRDKASSHLERHRDALKTE